jgi:intraflagellar transport protein 80
VTGVGWFNGSDFIAATEDKLVQRFSLNNTLQSEFDPKTITELPSYPMCMEWCVVQHGVSPDIFAVGMSDGSLLIINSTGRIEKTVPNAHTGAVTSLAWNRDGSTLATGGEDGIVKLWSPQGNLRSRLTQLSAPALALTWDASSQFIVCAHGDQLVRKSVTPDTKDILFTGHTGVVLCVTYSPVLGLYLSGAEDNCYKLWDKNGRCVFSSEPTDLPITSVAFSPLGTSFVCGTYDCLLLCDKQGWVSDRLLLTPNTTANTNTGAGTGANTSSGLGVGSLYSVAYSPDGAALALGSAAGHVIVASIFNLRAECDGWVCFSGAANNVYVGQIDRDEEDTLDVNG